jgi:hypothetical protein
MHASSTGVGHRRRGFGLHRSSYGGWLWFVVLMTAGPAGCSSNASKLPPLAPVSGTITMDGQPLAGAEVVFMSPSGHPSIGATDGDGKYTLMYRGTHPGAGPGLNSVIVRSIPKDPNVPIEKEPIPAVYNLKTTLTADVAPATVNTFDFELKSRK